MHLVLPQKIISNSKTIKQLYIIGAGSVGGHIAANPLLYGLDDTEIFFIDREPSKIGKIFLGKKIIGSVDDLLKINEQINVIIGVAFPDIKYRIYRRFSSRDNIIFPSLIASNAWVSGDVAIGKGVIVYPNCSINYGTIINDFTILNMNCAIGHECNIGEFSSLAPGVNLGGNSVIGKFTEMGIGSSTRQLIKIGNHVQVGGQSMVVNNLNSGVKVKGIPAREF
jgi:sugar O-acyltransferase (sialic acid O-acetyltransferase NeuD family)